MENLREKFLTECTACYGTGVFEEPYCTFENETHYRDVLCGCEDGKEVDWENLHKEIQATKESIDELEVSVLGLNQIMRENLDVDNGHVLNAFRQIVKYEAEIIKQEEYLALLEEF